MFADANSSTAGLHVARKSPEDRPESLTSFRAINSRRAHGEGGRCKCVVRAHVHRRALVRRAAPGRPRARVAQRGQELHRFHRCGSRERGPGGHAPGPREAAQSPGLVSGPRRAGYPSRCNASRGCGNHSDRRWKTGLNRSSQHWVRGGRTVAVRELGVGSKVAWLSPRRLARRAGRERREPRARPAPGACSSVLSSCRVQLAAARCSSSTSAGVRQPSVLRGRLFRASATAARSSGLWRARSVPLGKY
jgi:hypothetical protein